MLNILKNQGFKARSRATTFNPNPEAAKQNVETQE